MANSTMAAPDSPSAAPAVSVLSLGCAAETDVAWAKMVGAEPSRADARLLKDVAKAKSVKDWGRIPAVRTKLERGKATPEEVLGAYHSLARIVHPTHADRLGFRGREDAIDVLFEQATEAYLVLSDPRRRASYNMIMGIQLTTEVDAATRDEEKKRLARQHYVRAGRCISEMDYSLAVDLLKEAARLDPKAEYFARLGQAQTKNPHWHRHAVESYRRAVELAPDDAGIRMGYGQALEAMERLSDARQQYRETLRLMPDHAGAKDALDRIGK